MSGATASSTYATPNPTHSRLLIRVQTGEAAERKYAPVTFEAAGLAVAGLLRLLGSGGWYDEADLAPGLVIAEQAAVELPRCAVSSVPFLFSATCRRALRYTHGGGNQWRASVDPVLRHASAEQTAMSLALCTIGASTCARLFMRLQSGCSIHAFLGVQWGLLGCGPS